MPIRSLAFALVAVACVAHAAPPKSKTPKQDAATTQGTPEAIDVDALARSKDVDGSTPASTDAPPSDAPPPAEIPSESPAPADAAAAEPPPAEPVTEAAPAETAPASVPTAPAPTAASEAAAAAAKAGTSPPPATSAETADRISVAAGCQARATNLLDSAEKADFAGATSAFDARMRTAMPPPKLKEAWDQLAQFGKLQARGQSHLGSGDGYTVVMIPLIFEKANLVAQIACGTDGRIAGFYVKPAPMSPAPAPNS